MREEGEVRNRESRKGGRHWRRSVAIGSKRSKQAPPRGARTRLVSDVRPVRLGGRADALVSLHAPHTQAHMVFQEQGGIKVGCSDTRHSTPICSAPQFDAAQYSSR